MKTFLSFRNFFFIAIFLNFLLNSFLSGYSIHDKSVDDTFEPYDDLEDDYVEQTLRRISRTTHRNHVHRTPEEEFQCSQNRRSADGEGTLNVDGICSKHREIHNSLKELRCGKPHLKMVKLKLPAPNIELIPSVAQVRRCSGECTHPKACMPTKKSTKRVPVYKIDKSKGSHSRECVDFELEEHEECACSCPIKSHHCTAKQIYEESKCACICKNQEEKIRCLQSSYYDMARLGDPVQRFWDDAACDCTCDPLECPKPLVWIPILCRCVKIPGDETENALY